MSDARVRRTKPDAALSPEPLERGRDLFRAQRMERRFPGAVAADAVDAARGRRSPPPRLVGGADGARRGDAGDAGARVSTRVSRRARIWPRRGPRSGWGFACSRAAKPGAPADGSAGRNGWSSAKAATAPSRAISSCRVGQRHLNAGEFVEAHDAAARAAEFGERFGEADLVAFARNLQGRALLGQASSTRACPAGRGDGGRDLGRAVAGRDRHHLLQCDRELPTGLCARPRARVDRRPDQLVRGASAARHVHRVLPRPPGGGHADERLLAGGGRGGAARGGALRTRHRARRGRPRALPAGARSIACAANSPQPKRPTATPAASGVEPQPGLALLRLAQGDNGRRGQRHPSRRRRQPAVACRARVSCPRTSRSCWPRAISRRRDAASRELEQTALDCGLEVLAAIAAHADGAVRLAEGNPGAALDPARRAFGVWQQLGAPYLAARLRVLLARACVALGDVEGGAARARRCARGLRATRRPARPRRARRDPGASLADRKETRTPRTA